MKNDEAAAEEQARLQALHRNDILDTEAEPAFDRAAQIAQAIADVPVAMVNFVDEERRWCKACTGSPSRVIPRALSFCEQIVRTKEALYVPDAAADPRFQAHPLVVGPPYMRFYAGVPLRVEDDKVVGTLCLIDQVSRQLNQQQFDALASLARMVEHELALRRIAYTDPLTGVYNRRLFFDMAEREIARARRSGALVAIAHLDVDQFKAVNDKWGHEFGDRVLTAVTGACRQNIRQEDTLFRMGGDEFVVLFAESTAVGAERAGERLRSAVAQAELALPDPSLHPSVSVGVVKSAPGPDGRANRLLDQADQALYRAKAAGGNRVSVVERDAAASG